MEESTLVGCVERTRDQRVNLQKRQSSSFYCVTLTVAVGDWLLTALQKLQNDDELIYFKELIVW